MMITLESVGTFIAVSCALPISLFVLLYAKRSAWRSTDAGRALMYQSIAMLVIMGIVVTTLIFGDYPGRHAVRVVGYTALFFTLTKTLTVLVRYQNGREGQDYIAQRKREDAERLQWETEHAAWLKDHRENDQKFPPAPKPGQPS